MNDQQSSSQDSDLQPLDDAVGENRSELAASDEVLFASAPSETTVAADAELESAPEQESQQEPDAQASSTAQLNQASDLLSALGEISRRFDQREERLEARLSAFEQTLEALQMDQAERDEQRRTRETLHEKVQTAKSVYRFQLLQPFVQRLASLHDLISDFDRVPAEDPRIWQESLRLLKRHVEQTLEDQGMAAIQPAPGDAFDARWHHIVGTADTCDQQVDGRVKEIAQTGFLYFAQHDRTGDLRPTVVRPARVITWRYCPTCPSAAAAPDPSPLVESSAEPPSHGAPPEN